MGLPFNGDFLRYMSLPVSLSVSLSVSVSVSVSQSVSLLQPTQRPLNPGLVQPVIAAQ